MEKIGRYLNLVELARGGMSTIYLADDPLFNRRVAIKVLPKQFSHDPRFLERFRQEVEIVAALEHQNIVPVYDFGEHEDQSYLVMRYMSGGTLADVIDQDQLSTAETIDILRPISAALDYAHSQGVVHRDLKPGNILFDQNGAAYLSDFGIIRLAESTKSFTGSAVIGTPAYMSPEQVKGGVEIDGRSDVYALGIVMYEILSGDVPYSGDTPTQQLMKHVLEPVPEIRRDNPDVLPTVEAVLKCALAKDPEARYTTAGELVNALEEALLTKHELASITNSHGPKPLLPVASAGRVDSGPTTLPPLPKSEPTELYDFQDQPTPAESKSSHITKRILTGCAILIGVIVFASGSLLALLLINPSIPSTPTVVGGLIPPEVVPYTPTGLPETEESIHPTTSPPPTEVLPTMEASPTHTPPFTETPTPTRTATPTPSITVTPTETPNWKGTEQSLTLTADSLAARAATQTAIVRQSLTQTAIAATRTQAAVQTLTAIPIMTAQAGTETAIFRYSLTQTAISAARTQAAAQTSTAQALIERSYIVLYEDDTYRGRSLTIPIYLGGRANIRESSVLHDETSSFELCAPGTVSVVLYEHHTFDAGYPGNSGTWQGNNSCKKINKSDLQNRGIHDNISSIKWLVNGELFNGTVYFIP